MMPLNRTHRSDYYFGGEDGRTKQFSRKQAGELLSDVNEAESQLRDYYDNADENYQIVEGIISSIPLAVHTPKQYYAIKSGKVGIRELRYEPKSRVPLEAITIKSTFDETTPIHLPPSSYLYSYKAELLTDKYGESICQLIGATHRVSPSMYYAWIYQLSQVGVITYYTINYVETAMLLVAIYNNCQKPPEEHTTLQRYIRPRIQIKKYNHHVLTLMGIAGAELGEVRATALISYFGTAFSVFMASVDELCQVEGIGKKTAEKLLTSIGREL